MTTPAATLDAGLRAVVAQHGGRTAVEAGARRLSYRELDGVVDETVGWLLDRDVAPGDRVLLKLDKGLAFLALHLANLRLGSVTVPLNPAATPDEVAQAQADCRPRLVVTDLAADEPPVGRRRMTHSAPGPDDLACLLYTSGTTGPPKGARLLHRQLAANVSALGDAWGWTADDRLLHALPLFHVHGLFVAASVALSCGAHIVLEPRFDPDRTWEALLSGRITLFMGVPTMYHRLLASAPPAVPRPVPVRLFTSGSAPLRVDTLKAFEALTGHVILERYGMTEVGMAASNPLHGRRKPGSVGPALPTVGLRVVRTGPTTVAGTAGTAASAARLGEVGEVQISGPSVFDGYWERPEQTAATFTPDGWLRSGDLGFLDADGYLHLVGRAKELVISGGENVSPREVERVLEGHPEVAECAVCGVPDDDLGELVVAGVVLRPGAAMTDDPDASALIAWARERLAPHKLPRRIAFLSELPRNAMGKVQKARLAALPELREGGR